MITENHTECVEAVERAAKKPAAVALFEKLLFL